MIGGVPAAFKQNFQTSIQRFTLSPLVRSTHAVFGCCAKSDRLSREDFPSDINLSANFMKGVRAPVHRVMSAVRVKVVVHAYFLKKKSRQAL